MYHRVQLPSGSIAVTDNSGSVRLFKTHTDANYYESNNNPDFSWAKAKRLPELTPKQQIRTMFSEILGPDPIPNLWPKDLLK